jgi:predicted ester cyclase
MHSDWRKQFPAMLVFATCAALAVCNFALAADRTGTPHTLTDRLSALEESSYAAWKSGDTTFWKTFLADNFVGWGSAGRLDGGAAVAVLSGSECQIDNYRLTDIQVTELTAHAAVLTHRTDVKGVCRGSTVAPAYYTATVFVREGTDWKAAFRAQSAIVDPIKAVRPAASVQWIDGATSTDAATQTLLGREQPMVSAWKDHDAGRMDKYFGPEMQFIDIFGDHIATRAQALKAWSGEGCDVKSFEFSGARATMFAPNFGVLTYRASYDAKCFGQDVWPIWGTAFYVKRGDTWMWSGGINVLAGAEWAAAPAAGSTAGDMSASSLEANKALVREVFAAFQSGNVDVLNRIFSRDEIFHGPSGAPEAGRPETQSLQTACPMCAALNPRRITIDQIVAEGDLVAIRSTWSGTFSGDFRGAKVSGAPVSVSFQNVYRISRGQIYENWAIPDVASLEQQLGFTVSPSKGVN